MISKARPTRLVSMAGFFLVALIFASPAYAFRCGSKIVIENMHELQVRIACGEPTTIRHVGYAVRDINLRSRRGFSDGLSSGNLQRYGYYSEEVAVTEYVYNFGPRKFMRRLLFEGGVLVSIESIGYGYHESKSSP